MHRWLVLLCIITLTAVGCGKSLQRLTGVAKTQAGPVLSSSQLDVSDDPAPNPEPGGGYYDYQDTWGGGAHSLPYGLEYVTAQGVLAHALTMQCVQTAMSRMTELGCVRRSDLDYAITKHGYSCVVLGYQFPGVDPTVAGNPVPTVLVASRSVELPGVAYVPATQVSLPTVRDSAGVIVLAGGTLEVVEADSEQPDAMVAAIDSASRVATPNEMLPSLYWHSTSERDRNDITFGTTDRSERFAEGFTTAFLQGSMDGAKASVEAQIAAGLARGTAPNYYLVGIQATFGGVNASMKYWQSYRDTTSHP